MEAKLSVVGGKANKRTISLDLPTVIGRSQEAELTIAHPMISRQHCELYEVDGLLMIRDLGSLNGTNVEGQQISESPLRPDDEFTVGPLTFRAMYEYDGDLDAIPEPKLAVKDDEEVAIEPEEDAETDSQRQQKKKAAPAAARSAARKPARAAGAKSGETAGDDPLSDFFASLEDEPSSEDRDEDLDSFFKGLQ